MSRSEEIFREKLHQGIREGVANAIERHRRLGESIVISENGKVVKLGPEEILKRQKAQKEK